MSLISYIKNKISPLISVGLLCLLTSLTMADDTEIFKAEKPVAPPNVLFVFDNSGSMKYELTSENEAAREEDSRLGTLRVSLGRALDQIAIDPKIDDINIGMMNFSGHSGSWLAHGPSYPVVSIKANAQATLNSNGSFTHRGTSYQPAVVNPGTDKTTDYLKTISSQWKGKGKTPLVDSLYEAALYMKGEVVDRGKKPPSNKRAAHPSTYTGLIGVSSSSTTNLVCNYKPCGGNTGVNCNATMRNCTTATEAWHWCGLASEAACLAANPTYTRCEAQTNTNCSRPCLARDEAGSCISRGPEQCTTQNYFDCVEPVNTTTCEHEVCENVTNTDNEIVGTATYNSPITEECQSSHIVLLSDGVATINTKSDDVATFITNKGGNAGNCKAGTSDERCGRELATYLANNDHLTSGPNKEGEHLINVHTIGLSLADNDEGKAAKKFLEDVAHAGKGKSIFTSDPEVLVNELRGFANPPVNKARSFSSPSYTLDPSSVLSHGSEVYLPVFKPTQSSVWSGNLKKFKLDAKGKLVGKGNVDASDATGSLNPIVKDYWANGAADSVDKDVVLDGGVANLLDPDARKLFTDNGATTMLDLDTTYSGLSDTLVHFIRGKKDGKADGAPRHHMGDIIHNKPIHLSYGTNQGVVFVGTNEGYLHAFDTNEGTEIFAYMPSSLLSNINPQFQAVVNGANSKHLYGIDGEMTLRHDDSNHNNIVDTGEKVVLYFGLRRGGEKYFALDVSNPASPKLLWQKDSSSFSALAHTWSKPVFAKLKYGGSSALAKPVLIFGGGYSETTDSSGNISEKPLAGNAVYIVNANTGAVVWSTKVAEANGYSISSAKINNAVPSKVRVLDIDRNGSVDRLYFSDTGGNIWRVDLNASDLDGSGDFANINKALLSKLASLGDSKRKFFVEPDVAFFKYRGQYVLSVSIGSGDRSKPLSTGNDDYFFALFDENVLNVPDRSTHRTMTMHHLASAPTTEDLISPLRRNKGWKMKLATPTVEGEKVLSTALTFQNNVLFTSFGKNKGTIHNADKCDRTTINVSKLYAVNLLNGGATLDLNGDGVINNNDLSVTVGLGEIVDTPQVVISKPKAKDGSACTPSDCLRPFEIRAGKASLGFANNKTTTNQSTIGKLPRVYWIDKNQNK